MDSRLLTQIAFCGWFLLCSAGAIFGQDAAIVRGRITDLHLSEDKQTVLLTIGLDLTIKNETSSDLILLNQEHKIVGNALRTGSAPKGGLLYQDTFSPSAGLPSIWIDLQRKLDMPSPPKALTLLLRPGDSLKLKTTTRISISRDERYQEPWDVIAKSSPVWLSVRLEFFPTNLDSVLPSRRSFGKHLQKKWAKFGGLQVNSIWSEPMRLELPNTSINPE